MHLLVKLVEGWTPSVRLVMNNVEYLLLAFKASCMQVVIEFKAGCEMGLVRGEHSHLYYIPQGRCFCVRIASGADSEGAASCDGPVSRVASRDGTTGQDRRERAITVGGGPSDLLAKQASAWAVAPSMVASAGEIDRDLAATHS